MIIQFSCENHSRLKEVRAKRFRGEKSMQYVLATESTKDTEVERAWWSDFGRDYCCLSYSWMNPLDSIVDKIDSHGGLLKIGMLCVGANLIRNDEVHGGFFCHEIH